MKEMRYFWRKKTNKGLVNILPEKRDTSDFRLYIYCITELYDDEAKKLYM